MDSERNFGLNEGQNWKTCSRSGYGGCRGKFCFLLVCTYQLLQVFSNLFLATFRHKLDFYMFRCLS